MKAFNISLLAALISAPLAAQNIDKTWEVGVFGDYIKSSTNKEDLIDWQQIEAGKSLGLDLQKIINEQWNVRLELARTRFDTENGHDKEYGNRYGIDAIYHIKDSNAYTFAGVKRFNNVKSYNAVNLGAGYTVSINDNLSLYSEAAVYRDVDYGYTDQGIKLGMKYTFGKTQPAPVIKQAKPVKPAKPVTVADSDNDGVNDNNDQCRHTPANVKVDAKGCTVFTNETVEMSLTVAFAHDSATIKPSSIHEIKQLADFMNKYPDTSVEIAGHTSSVGSAEYNLGLSQQRADAVMNVLVDTFNINDSRLSAKGYGESQLLSADNSASAHEKNRRVVAKITATEKKAQVKH
ncbi:hypothetical protein tinsulaeT_19220 [Thalassotalea insulae]|uniref:OmpA-like domain-containing protein n=1 Tax=Thalassotalea insulae TaxID=2056778 RepID=A0ABQ6GRN5_9GAMM|nr:OmpA family protein [Thalassotalea insulae]GLX78582.1 hypothetical protein tinsulaeT_19220 [Thalassotalea insulae]